MASEKQIAANRANAKRSTGPKTAAGKLRSSRNAFRHGLSGPLPSIQQLRRRSTGLPVRSPVTRRATIKKRELKVLLAPRWSCCGSDRSDPNNWPRLTWPIARMATCAN